MLKDTAYAWRQMLCYLSLVDSADLAKFLDWSLAHVGAQRGEFAERFEPVIAGLRIVAEGETFDADGQHVSSGGRRFLGSTVRQRHWLLPQVDEARQDWRRSECVGCFPG